MYHSQQQQYDEVTVTRQGKGPQMDLQEVHREIRSHLLLTPVG